MFFKWRSLSLLSNSTQEFVQVTVTIFPKLLSSVVVKEKEGLNRIPFTSQTRVVPCFILSLLPIIYHSYSWICLLKNHITSAFSVVGKSL